MLALPVDARARAACVCRSWRAFLADPEMRQVLHLTVAEGVEAERATVDLARGAGRTQALFLTGLAWPRSLTLRPLLLDVVVPHQAELQWLYTDAHLDVRDVEPLFAAAPRLQRLNADVSGPCKEVISVLRNDPPYGPLRVAELQVWFYDDHLVEGDLLALAAAVRAHESLKGLVLYLAPFARELNALVDAAAERRVSRLQIITSSVDAEFIPTLARLLQLGTLTDLVVFNDLFPLAQEASVPVLCAALKACRTLTRLKLRLKPHNGASRRTVTKVLDAAASLPTLSMLDLYASNFRNPVAAGRAFGRLLAANPPSLRTLSVHSCTLGDEGLAPVLDGLAANTHLRVLDCQEGNGLSEAFKRDRLAPALAALAARAELDA